MSRVTVVGMGNPWRGDDGVGPFVARRLRDDPPEGVRVVDWEGEPTGLLELWRGADEVIVIDSLRSGGEPGTVRRLDALAGPVRPEHACSTHAFNLSEVVELGRALDRLPARLLVYGIEGRSFTAGSGLSPEVERAGRALARDLRRRLSERSRSAR